MYKEFPDEIYNDDGKVKEYIPKDPENTKYQEYLVWVSKGNVADKDTEAYAREAAIAKAVEDKEQALVDLRKEDIGAITTIKALKDRVTNLEKYLGI